MNISEKRFRVFALIFGLIGTLILLFGCSSTQTVIKPITEQVPVPAMKDSVVMKDSTIYNFVDVPWYVPHDTTIVNYKDSILYKKVSMPFKVWKGDKVTARGDVIHGEFNEYLKQLNLDISYAPVPFTRIDTTKYVTQSKSLMDKITDNIARVLS